MTLVVRHHPVDCIEIVMTENRSLTPRSVRCAAMVWVAIGSSISIAATSSGAWPVAIFQVGVMLLLIAMLDRFSRSEPRSETLVIKDRQVRYSGSGRADEVLPLPMTQLHIGRDRWNGRQLEFRCLGRQVHFGNSLSPDERREVAALLTRFLQGA